MESTRRLTPRRDPQQQRSKDRIQLILEVTARLMDEVGFDDLTTILIAKEAGMSVGTLYHYFPNKHSILRAIARNWLDHWDQVILEINALPIETMEMEEVVNILIDTFARVYQKQKGILHLVRAMFAIPELKDLDERHDEFIIANMANILPQIGINKSLTDRKYIARTYLEMTHALLLVACQQRGTRARQTLEDTRELVYCLFLRHL
jgi:AcrR family transcriptional regulator